MSEYKTKTVSGPIATFNDALEGSDLADVICKVNPVQDLHGYDSPWPGGGGKNLFDPSGSLVITSGTGAKKIGDDDLISAVSTGSDGRGWGYSSSDFKFSLTAGTYVITLFVIKASTNTSAAINIYNSEGTAISNFPNSQMTVIGTYYKNLTLSVDTDIGLMSKLYDGQIKIMISSGSEQPTSFERYANICPIIGCDNINITFSGDNILKLYLGRTSHSGIDFSLTNDGKLHLEGTNTSSTSSAFSDGNYSDYNSCPLKFPPGTYTISSTIASTDPNIGGVNFMIRTRTNNDYSIYYTKTGAKTFTVNDHFGAWFWVSILKSSTVNMDIGLKLEVGSSASTFVPCSAETKKLSFSPFGKNLFDKDHANVVNGYIDTSKFNTGNSNAKTIYIPIIGGETYTVSKTAGLRFSIVTSDVIPSNGALYTSRKANNTASSLSITAGENDKYLWAWVYLGGTDTGTLEEMLASVQIEQSSSATAYEPYQNMFRGYVNPVIGMAEGNIKKITINSAFDKNGTWDSTTGKGAFWYTTLSTLGISDANLKFNNDGVFCYIFPIRDNVGTTNTTNGITIYPNGIIRWIDLQHMEESKEDYNTYLADHPIIVTYACTSKSQSIESYNRQTFLGLNNIWHDANGDTTIAYYYESIDQVSKYFIKGTTLTSIANAIRTVKGTSAPIEVDDFIDEIDSMTLQLPAAEEVEF